MSSLTLIWTIPAIIVLALATGVIITRAVYAIRLRMERECEPGHIKRVMQTLSGKSSKTERIRKMDNIWIDDFEPNNTATNEMLGLHQCILCGQWFVPRHIRQSMCLECILQESWD